jgi:hypothetical protein|tara:strand:+ start:164 stop:961 length:798 start_codon:yes stop_codon:yes gene_type:complete
MLDVYEWDFDCCPGARKPLKSKEVDELRECWHWEFARESEGITNKVLSLRKRLRKKTFKNFHEKLRNKNSPWNNLLLDHGIYIYSPEFPYSPYLSIPMQERLDRHETLFHGWEKETSNSLSVGHSDLDEIIFKDFLSARERGERYFIPGLGEPGFVEPVLLKINWHNSNASLIEHFRYWLELNRPKKSMNRAGRASSSSRFRTLLKALGARRLLKKYTVDEAHRLTKRHSVERYPLFQHSNKWGLAQTKIDHLISKSEEICAKFP